ncbi:MAG: STAS domain-containing protein [Myxococcaceae bacterium]|nr:STAS domain-containing protein [Myxococcaceae bacterium]
MSLRREALAAWRPGLLERLRRDEVRLDASDVAEVDGPSLEGLVAFVEQRRRAGQRTTWSAVSAQLRRAATWLGFSEALELPPEGT